MYLANIEKLFDRRDDDGVFCKGIEKYKKASNYITFIYMVTCLNKLESSKVAYY